MRPRRVGSMGLMEQAEPTGSTGGLRSAGWTGNTVRPGDKGRTGNKGGTRLTRNADVMPEAVTPAATPRTGTMAWPGRTADAGQASLVTSRAGCGRGRQAGTAGWRPAGGAILR